MTTNEFIGALAIELADFPEQEKYEALAYVREFLEEAQMNDEDATIQLGTPKEYAASLREAMRDALPPQPPVFLDGDPGCQDSCAAQWQIPHLPKQPDGGRTVKEESIEENEGFLGWKNSNGLKHLLKCISCPRQVIPLLLTGLGIILWMALIGWLITALWMWHDSAHNLWDGIIQIGMVLIGMGVLVWLEEWVQKKWMGPLHQELAIQARKGVKESWKSSR